MYCIDFFLSIQGARYVLFEFIDLTVACKLIDPLLHEDSLFAGARRSSRGESGV